MVNYINIYSIEKAAKIKLDKGIYDFIFGGATDELTLERNRTALDAIQLTPRVLAGVGETDLSTTLLGIPLAFPMIGAPLAFQRLVDPEGEIAVAKSLHDNNLVYTSSTMSSISLEQIAEKSPGPKWFQLYIYKDRAITLELIQRAENAGYQGIMLTVDVPVMGKRERDYVNEFELPEHIFAANFIANSDERTSQNVRNRSAIKIFTDKQFEPNLNWNDVLWLKSKTSLPIILKGIMRDSDAVKAVEYGADAIVVSNHGGRQLDGVISSIEVLPKIARKIDKKIPVLFDSGIRRGTDILKALALGADCVLIGRPLLWGLSAAGELGVKKVLSILQEELIEAMMLCGYSSVIDLQNNKGLIANSFLNVETNSEFS